MPKLAGILETSLYVDDTKLSADFYHSILGFDTIATTERVIAMSVGHQQVLLLFKKGASTHPTVTAGGAVPPTDGDGELHVAFKIAASAYERWKAWLEQNGIPVESEVTWELGGRSLYFRDPDQHVIELATPGVWSVY